MFDKKFDQSLLDKITKVMSVSSNIDTHKKRLNESIGIYDKKELPSELHESYDKALNSLISGEENPTEIESLKEAVSEPKPKKKKATKEYDVDTERKLADKDTEYGVDTERDLAKKEQPKKAKYMEENRMSPADAGRLAVAADDGGLINGTPADKGMVAAMIDDRKRKKTSTIRMIRAKAKKG